MIWISLALAALFGAHVLAALVSAQDGVRWWPMAVNAALSLAGCLWLVPTPQ